MKILVADDTKTSLEMIKQILKSFGHEVIAVSSGEVAIVVFQDHRPDLIILDVVMQGIDGYECARRIRAIDPDDWVPIIFLSASIDDKSIAKGIDAGGDDYLTKPFSEITLMAKIKAMERIANMRKNLFSLTEQLQALSATDRLTGLYNRLQFETSMKEKLSEAERFHQTVALLFLDLDRFKIVNDTLGHHVGDLLLQAVAERLKKCLRVYDIVARLGGDEFAIILSGPDISNHAETVAQKIIAEIAEPYHLAEYDVHIGVSIGIAIYPSMADNEQKLMQSADAAMYFAKKSGKNTFKFYSEITDALT